MPAGHIISKIMCASSCDTDDDATYVQDGHLIDIRPARQQDSTQFPINPNGDSKGFNHRYAFHATAKAVVHLEGRTNAIFNREVTYDVNYL